MLTFEAIEVTKPSQFDQFYYNNSEVNATFQVSAYASIHYLYSGGDVCHSWCDDVFQTETETCISGLLTGADIPDN